MRVGTLLQPDDTSTFIGLFLMTFLLLLVCFEYKFYFYSFVFNGILTFIFLLHSNNISFVSFKLIQIGVIFFDIKVKVIFTGFRIRNLI